MTDEETLESIDTDRLVRHIHMLKQEQVELRDTLTRYQNEVIRRMASQKQLVYNHPEFKVERKENNEYSWSAADCKEFIRVARRLGFPENEIQKAIRVEKKIVYSTKKPSIDKLAKRAGHPLLEIAARVVVTPKDDSLMVAPLKSSLTVPLRSVNGDE